MALDFIPAAALAEQTLQKRKANNLLSSTQLASGVQGKPWETPPSILGVPIKSAAKNAPYPGFQSSIRDVASRMEHKYGGNSLEAAMETVDAALPNATASQREAIKYRLQRLGVGGKLPFRGGKPPLGRLQTEVDPLDLVNVLKATGLLSKEADSILTKSVAPEKEAVIADLNSRLDEERKGAKKAKYGAFYESLVGKASDVMMNTPVGGLPVTPRIAMQAVLGQDLASRTEKLRSSRLAESITNAMVPDEAYAAGMQPLVQTFRLGTQVLPQFISAPPITEAMGQANLERKGSYSDADFGLGATLQGLGDAAAFIPSAPLKLGLLGNIIGQSLNAGTGGAIEQGGLDMLQALGLYDPTKDAKAPAQEAGILPALKQVVGATSEEETGIPTWAQVLHGVLGIAAGMNFKKAPKGAAPSAHEGTVMPHTTPPVDTGPQALGMSKRARAMARLSGESVKDEGVYEAGGSEIKALERSNLVPKENFNYDYSGGRAELAYLRYAENLDILDRALKSLYPHGPISLRLGAKDILNRAVKQPHGGMKALSRLVGPTVAKELVEVYIQSMGKGEPHTTREIISAAKSEEGITLFHGSSNITNLAKGDPFRPTIYSGPGGRGIYTAVDPTRAIDYSYGSPDESTTNGVVSLNIKNANLKDADQMVPVKVLKKLNRALLNEARDNGRTIESFHDLFPLKGVPWSLLIERVEDAREWYTNKADTAGAMQFVVRHTGVDGVARIGRQDGGTAILWSADKSFPKGAHSVNDFAATGAGSNPFIDEKGYGLGRSKAIPLTERKIELAARQGPYDPGEAPNLLDLARNQQPQPEPTTGATPQFDRSRLSPAVAQLAELADSMAAKHEALRASRLPTTTGLEAIEQQAQALIDSGQVEVKMVNGKPSVKSLSRHLQNKLNISGADATRVAKAMVNSGKVLPKMTSSELAGTADEYAPAESTAIEEANMVDGVFRNESGDLRIAAEEANVLKAQAMSRLSKGENVATVIQDAQREVARLASAKPLEQANTPQEAVKTQEDYRRAIAEAESMSNEERAAFAQAADRVAEALGGEMAPTVKKQLKMMLDLYNKSVRGGDALGIKQYGEVLHDALSDLSGAKPKATSGKKGKASKQTGAVDATALTKMALMATAGGLAWAGVSAAYKAFDEATTEEEKKMASIAALGVVMGGLMFKRGGKNIMSHMSDKYGWGLNPLEASRKQKFNSTTARLVRSVHDRLGMLGNSFTLDIRNNIEQAKQVAYAKNVENEQTIIASAASLDKIGRRRMLGTAHEPLKDVSVDAIYEMEDRAKYLDDAKADYSQAPLYRYYHDKASLSPEEIHVIETAMDIYNEQGKTSWIESGSGPRIMLDNAEAVATLKVGMEVIRKSSTGEYVRGVITALKPGSDSEPPRYIVDWKDGSTAKIRADGEGEGFVYRPTVMNIKETPGRFLRSEVSRALVDGENDKTGIYELLQTVLMEKAIEEEGVAAGTQRAQSALQELRSYAQGVYSSLTGRNLLDAAILHPRIKEALPEWAYDWSLKRLLKQNESAVEQNEYAKVLGGPSYDSVTRALDEIGVHPAERGELIDLLKTYMGKPLSHIESPGALEQFMRFKESAATVSSAVVAAALFGEKVGPTQLTTIANNFSANGIFAGTGVAKYVMEMIKAIGSPKKATAAMRAELAAEKEFLRAHGGDMPTVEKLIREAGVSPPAWAAKNIAQYARWVSGGGEFGHNLTLMGVTDMETQAHAIFDRRVQEHYEAALGRGGAGIGNTIRSGADAAVDLALAGTLLKPLDTLGRKVDATATLKAVQYQAKMLGKWMDKRLPGWANRLGDTDVLNAMAEHRFGRHLFEETRLNSLQIAQLMAGGTMPDDVATAVVNAASRNQGRTTAQYMPRWVSKSEAAPLITALNKFTYRQTSMFYRATRESARGNHLPLLRMIAATTAMGYALPWMKDKVADLWDWTFSRVFSGVAPLVVQNMELGRQIIEAEDSVRDAKQSAKDGDMAVAARKFTELGMAGILGLPLQYASSDEQSWMYRMSPGELAQRQLSGAVVTGLPNMVAGAAKAAEPDEMSQQLYGGRAQAGLAGLLKLTSYGRKRLNRVERAAKEWRKNRDKGE